MNLTDEIRRFIEMLQYVRTSTDILSNSAPYFLKAEKELRELENELLENLKGKYNFFIEAEKR